MGKMHSTNYSDSHKRPTESDVTNFVGWAHFELAQCLSPAYYFVCQTDYISTGETDQNFRMGSSPIVYFLVKFTPYEKPALFRALQYYNFTY